MSLDDDVRQLRILMSELTRRVYRIERQLGISPEPEMQRPVERAAQPPEQRPEPPPPVAPAMPHIPPRQAGTGEWTRAAAMQDESDNLERKIGSHWLNRIGIAAVLLGASFFLKYAYDNGWIGPAGQVAIMLIAGIATVLWSERFRRKSYVLFSYSLKAAGIGVIYLSLWAAFQLHHLIPAGVAFFAMIVVTAATAALAVSQDAEVLAALALVGGFMTPALVSTGENHEIVLFSYVALLDVASLVMVTFKPWRRLLIGSFVGTLIMYVGWYASFYTPDQFGTTLLFATLFMLIFGVAPVVVDTRSATSPQGSQTLLVLALSNAAVYFCQVLILFDEPTLREYRAWVAIGLAAFYIVLGRVLNEKVQRETEDKVNRLFPMLHIGIAVGLLTIAIPLKMSGHWITLGWLVEAAILFWVGTRTRMTLLRVLSLGALALGLLRLFAIDDWRTEHLVFNERFALYAVAIAVLVFMSAMQRRQVDEPGAAPLIGVGVVLINVLALVALCLEVESFFQRLVVQATPQPPAQHTPETWRDIRALNIVRDFAYSAVWMIYGTALMVVGFWKQQQFLRWQAIVLIGATIVKVFIYDVSALDRGYRIISFFALGAVLLAISFLYQRDILRLHAKAESAGGKP